MRVAVIGGGAAGLTTLKHLLEAHKYLGGDAVEAKLFESDEGIGGTFLKRMYEDAEVCTSFSRAKQQLAILLHIQPIETDHTYQVGVIQVSHSFLRLPGPP